MKATVDLGRRLLGNLPKGVDLLESLTKVCVDAGIELGEVRAIGAVAGCRLGYYEQFEKVYREFDLEGHYEVLSLVGNISLKDGQPFVHAHVTLGDTEGRSFGGHLVPGHAPVFALEYYIQELVSEAKFSRVMDEATGLFLWPVDEV